MLEKDTKAMKVKIVERKKKPLTKTELLAEYNALEKKYEEVIEEKDILLKKLAVFENLETKKVHTNDQVCQTKPDSKYVEISCTECIFLASSEDELNYHMGEEHDKDFISYFETDFPCSVCDRWCRSEKELNRHMKIYHCKRVKFCSYDCKSCDENVVDGKTPHVGNVQDMEINESVNKTNPQKDGKSRIGCNFCDKFFKSRNQLMIHKKQEHTEKVSVCWNFLHGNCRFGDSGCWFRHTSTSDHSEVCKICEKNFKTKNDLKIHEKSEHSYFVRICTNNDGDVCWYGERCWFRHEK